MNEIEVARFWDKVSLPDANGCMLWTAALSGVGYGVLKIRGQSHLAHRVSLSIAEGPSEDRVEAAHSCRNRHCVAPAHLRWATRAENEADKVLDGAVARGSGHGRAKLTEAQVLEIRERQSKGATHRSLALEFGVRRQTIGAIVNRTKWKHLQPGETQWV